MRVLVTGADGFAGRYLVRSLVAGGHRVTAAVRPGGEPASRWLTRSEAGQVTEAELQLESAESGAALVSQPHDAVVHLAAVASGAEARQDPGHAWVVNAAGTARLLEGLGQRRVAGTADPLVLLVSTGEVYGAGSGRPRLETDAVLPVSPYAASKAGAEVAAAEVARRTGLRVIVARAFQHTGPGQAPIYVVPALARRLAEARASGTTRVPVGNLAPVRDISDVRDVVAAYTALLARGVPGAVYNVCRGEGLSLAELFRKLSAIIGVDAEPETDPALTRRADIVHLVGDNSRLRADTGWAPALSLDQTLRDVVDAQAH
jgi:GDP-4-dehydro-6-deoxy-D-mannose reductase